MHAAGGTERGVDALEFAHDQAVGDVADAGAAVTLERRAEEAEFAHLAHHFAVEGFVAVPVADARREFFLRVLARGVADHPLFFGQLRFDQQRVVPLEMAAGEGD